MKHLILALSFLLPVQGFAASPFTVSGSKISAIFQSKVIWRKVFGEVENIALNGHKNGVSTFTVETTEMEPEIDSAGRTVGYRPSKCRVVVEVKNAGDDLAPNWEVSNIDFSGCPTTALKP